MRLLCLQPHVGVILKLGGQDNGLFWKPSGSFPVYPSNVSIIFENKNVGRGKNTVNPATFGLFL
jgi:hypothetical protein